MDYYESQEKKRLQGCRQASMVLAVLLIMILVGIFTCKATHAQSWSRATQAYARENAGVYPNTVSLTMNVKNESVGLIYGYTPRVPTLNLPIGYYAQISSTIPMSWHRPDYYKYNNYDWQRKYSLGLSLILPHPWQDSETHTMVTLGAVYNDLPDINTNHKLMPGQYDPDLEYTHKWGMDIGVRWVTHHVTVHIKTDVFNFMQYTEFGCGGNFSWRKSYYR